MRLEQDACGAVEAPAWRCAGGCADSEAGGGFRTLTRRKGAGRGHGGRHRADLRPARGARRAARDARARAQASADPRRTFGDARAHAPGAHARGDAAFGHRAVRGRSRRPHHLVRGRQPCRSRAESRDGAGAFGVGAARAVARVGRGGPHGAAGRSRPPPGEARRDRAQGQRGAAAGRRGARRRGRRLDVGHHLGRPRLRAAGAAGEAALAVARGDQPPPARAAQQRHRDDRPARADRAHRPPTRVAGAERRVQPAAAALPPTPRRLPRARRRPARARAASVLAPRGARARRSRAARASEVRRDHAAAALPDGCGEALRRRRRAHRAGRGARGRRGRGDEPRRPGGRERGGAAPGRPFGARDRRRGLGPRALRACVRAHLRRPRVGVGDVVGALRCERARAAGREAARRAAGWHPRGAQRARCRDDAQLQAGVGADRGDRPHADDARGDGELAPLPTGRVPLVDDGLDQQLVGRMLLERLGQQVDVAGDGAEAIAALDASRTTWC